MWFYVGNSSGIVNNLPHEGQFSRENMSSLLIEITGDNSTLYVGTTS